MSSIARSLHPAVAGTLPWSGAAVNARQRNAAAARGITGGAVPWKDATGRSVRVSVSKAGTDAVAALRKRAARLGDAALIATVADAERAFETLALERAAMQSRLAASATNSDRELTKLRTLGRVAETVNSSLELDVVLRAVLDTAVEVMEAERGFLMIANEHGQLELTTTHGIDRATVEGAAMRPSQTTVRRVFETGEPIVTTDAQQDPRFNVNTSVRAMRLRSTPRSRAPRSWRCRGVRQRLDGHSEPAEARRAESVAQT